MLRPLRLSVPSGAVRRLCAPVAEAVPVLRGYIFRAGKKSRCDRRVSGASRINIGRPSVDYRAALYRNRIVEQGR